MSADKYPSIFPRQMEAIAYVSVRNRSTNQIAGNSLFSSAIILIGGITACGELTGNIVGIILIVTYQRVCF